MSSCNATCYTISTAHRNQFIHYLLLFAWVSAFNSFPLNFYLSTLEAMERLLKRNETENETQSKLIKMKVSSHQLLCVGITWRIISRQFYWQVTEFAIILTWKNVSHKLVKSSKHIINRAHKLMHNAEF